MTTDTQVQPIKRKPWGKIIGILFVLGLIGAAIVYYFFNKKVPSTKDVKADYTLNALDFIAEFEKDDSIATVKYNGKYVSVKGKVVSVESTDSTCTVTIGSPDNTVNLRCGFAPAFVAEGKVMKENEEVVIKGKCNGAILSDDPDLKIGEVHMNLCAKE